MKLWLDLKPWVILTAILLIFFENVTRIRTVMEVLHGYIGLVIVLIIGLVMRAYMKKNKIWLSVAHASFIIDASVIIGAIYFHGLLETPWTFGPAFITFMGAYVFGITAGIVYAVYTTFVFSGIFFLEYYKIIPHFSIFHGIENLYWIDMGYFIDSLIGIFLLNFVMAIAVGLLSMITDRRNQRIEEYANKFGEAESRLAGIHAEAEGAAKALGEKIVEIKRNQALIEDRKKEIAEFEGEIERLRRTGGK